MTRFLHDRFTKIIINGNKSLTLPDGAYMCAHAKHMNKGRLLSFLILAAIASSCATPTAIPYFQDVDRSDSTAAVPENARPIIIRPEDKLSIIVNSRDMQITNMFNLPYVAQRIGQTSESLSSNYSQGIAGYLVDENGDIDFPVVGIIHVAGLTRDEVSKLIKDRIVSNGLAKDIVVTVEYMNLKVSVMGEVSRPGRYNIDRDEFTILDAISAAGDLTIYGKRDNIKVLRTIDGVKQTFLVDLTSASELVSSPVYYLQQNDVIYVEPNSVRARQSTVNGNNIRSTSFWISIASLASTVALYFLR